MTARVRFTMYDGTDPLPGLTPVFLQYQTLEGDSIAAQDRPEIQDFGGGLYGFDLTINDEVTGVQYIVDGITSIPRYETGDFDPVRNAEESSDPVSYADEGIDSRAEVLVGSPDSVVYYAKKNGAVQQITNGTQYVTILDPSGAVKVARQAATLVSASGGKLAFSRTWDEATFPLEEDYVALWEWTSDSVVYSDRQYFDVVRSKLQCLIDTSDIIEQYPDIISHLQAISQTDCTKFIKRGWSKLLNKIRAGKNRPSLILDRARLVDPAIEAACARVCRALSREPDDLWDQRRKDHLAEFESLFRGLGDLKYDKDEDGVASEEETKAINRRNFTV